MLISAKCISLVKSHPCVKQGPDELLVVALGLMKPQVVAAGWGMQGPHRGRGMGADQPLLQAA